MGTSSGVLSFKVPSSALSPDRGSVQPRQAHMRARALCIVSIGESAMHAYGWHIGYMEEVSIQAPRHLGTKAPRPQSIRFD